MSVVAVGAAGVAPVGSATGWTAVPAAHVSGQSEVLTAVVAPAAGDVWAIGNRFEFADGTQTVHTLAEHSDGGSFEIVATPDRGTAPADNRLYGVAASAPDDVWAVGSSSPDILHSETLVEHWDGNQWAIVDSPNPGSANVLRTVTVVASDDAWAGGVTRSSGSHFDALALHWDGVQWQQVGVPRPARCGGDWSLNGMSAVSARSVWASGSCGAASGTPQLGYVIHWNGTAWKVVLRGPRNSELLGVRARNDHDVWVVGSNAHGGLSLHWDGTSWSAPSAAPGAYRIASVETGPRGTWGVGDRDGVPFAPPWSGRFVAGAWRAKNVRVKIGSLRAITIDPALQLWAVGSQSLGSGDTGALVLTR
jgi:hypothetical protein